MALALHLFALIVPPLAMAPSSPLFSTLWRGMGPYLDVLYLGHGFHFFAPDPGPSHLIRYEVEQADGTRVTGVFPDPQEHSPRLLYHRHFMLTEYANRLAVDESRKADLDQLSASFAGHLLARHQGVKVQLFLQRHYIPTPAHVLQGLALNDPQFIHERSLGTWPVVAPVDTPRDIEIVPLTEPISEIAAR